MRGREAYRCRACRSRFYIGGIPAPDVDVPIEASPTPPPVTVSNLGTQKTTRLIGWIVAILFLAVIGIILVRHAKPKKRPPVENAQKEILFGFASAYWTLPVCPGLRTKADISGLRTEFSGTEGDTCVIAEQAIFLLPGKYTLKYAYRTTNIPPGTGLRWQIMDSRPNVIIAETPDLSGDALQNSTLEFTVPPSTSLLRVRVAYRRRADTKLIAGRLLVESVEIQPLPKK